MNISRWSFNNINQKLKIHINFDPTILLLRLRFFIMRMFTKIVLRIISNWRGKNYCLKMENW